MQTADFLEALGGLTAHLKSYASKLPPVVHLAAVPTGVKPPLEAIEEYETIIGRVRSLSAGTRYRGLADVLIDSLESFEAGRLLGAVQPLLVALDQVEQMSHEKELEVGRIDAKRIAEYRSVLRTILPGNKPELQSGERGL